MKHRFLPALLLSYISIASVAAAIITPALPMIQDAFHLGHGALEWVISIFLLGYVLGQLPYGPLANRIGRVNALRVGLLIYIAGLVICLLASYWLSYPWLLVGRLISALGAASGLACTFILINELLNHEEAKHTISFAVVSFTVGIGLAVSIGGWITQYLSWEICFWVLLVHAIIMLFFTHFLHEPAIKPIKINIRKLCHELISAIQHKTLVIFALMVGLVSAFSYGYSAVAPIYAVESLHLTPSQYGAWNLVNMLGMLGSGFFSAFLMKRYGAKKTLLIGTSVFAVILAGLALYTFLSVPSVGLFFTITTLMYFIVGLIFPSASFYASRAIECKANAASAMSFINMGSAMLFVVIIGYLPLSSLHALVLCLIVYFVLAGGLGIYQLIHNKALHNH